MAENEKLMPDWMREMQVDIELAEEKQRATAQRDHAASLLIQLERPRHWQHLREKLKIAADALPSLKLRGQFLIRGDDGMRISMNRSGLFASKTWTDLYLDQRCIRCTTLDAGSYNLQFRAISETEIAVIDEQGYAQPMDTDGAVKFIMRRMIKLIESPAGTPSLSRYGL